MEATPSASAAAYLNRIANSTVDVHPSMLAFLKHLEPNRRPQAIYKYSHNLVLFWHWLQKNNVDPMTATTDDLHAYQRWMAETYRMADGELLSLSSQVRRLSAIKGYYYFMERRGMILVNIAKRLKYPKVARYVTQRDYLSLQEVTALLQTQAKRVQSARTHLKWAIEFRNLALFCLAVATGRRHGGLRELKVADLDFERDEIRVEYEKGKTGRILPVAHWAMVIAKEYIKKARPRFQSSAQSEFLFVSKRNGTISHGMEDAIKSLHQQTVEENPDLTELSGKDLTVHGLRVTFAKLLFNGGCNLRSVNELMLHERLSTTSYYTPVKLHELRRACKTAHPRA